LVIAGSLAAFLFSAKAHGHQIRIERELAGYMEVSFGGVNPQFVVELWARERVIFWGIAGALAVLGASYAFAAVRLSWPLPLRGSWVGIAMLATAWPLIAAFVASGILSAMRAETIMPVALWWALTFLSATGVAVVAWRP
jgi:hypothetical protein